MRNNNNNNNLEIQLTSQRYLFECVSESSQNLN